MKSIRFPSLTARNDTQRLRQLERYLHYLVTELNDYFQKEGS